MVQAFNLLSVLIERLADGVAPFADGLLALLSQVWRSGEGQPLLRAQACPLSVSYKTIFLKNVQI